MMVNLPPVVHRNKDVVRFKPASGIRAFSSAPFVREGSWLELFQARKRVQRLLNLKTLAEQQ
ncbi:MAG TPA: hypothetical protein VH164_03855, partial [Ktedonobacteraceae bacterium]|nr:hypothetical protein [Ktedonobacteraceae bacterium]